MSDEHQPKKTASSDFVPVDTAKEIRIIIRSAALTHASSLFWIKERNEFVPSNIVEFQEEKNFFYARTISDFDIKGFAGQLAVRGSNECYFSVSLVQANTFFKTLFLGFDASGVKFKVPEQIFKVQRRRDMRCRIQDDNLLKVYFRDPALSGAPGAPAEKSIVDISASGLAFTARGSESPHYQKGQILKDAWITIRARKIPLELEIRHIFIIPKGQHQGDMKVGVRFLGIKESDSQWIASYVFDETRRYFSKFI